MPRLGCTFGPEAGRAQRPLESHGTSVLDAAGHRLDPVSAAPRHVPAKRIRQTNYEGSSALPFMHPVAPSYQRGKGRALTCFWSTPAGQIPLRRPRAPKCNLFGRQYLCRRQCACDEISHSGARLRHCISLLHDSPLCSGAPGLYSGLILSASDFHARTPNPRSPHNWSVYR